MLHHVIKLIHCFSKQINADCFALNICFIRYKTRGVYQAFISDKAQIASVLNDF